MQSANALKNDRRTAPPAPVRRPQQRHTPKPQPKRPIRKDKHHFRRSKNMPSIFKRGNIYFVVESESRQYRPSKAIAVSVVLIFLAAAAVIITNAQITTVEMQIAASTQALRTLQDEHTVLETQLASRYTIEDIEFLAFTRLGMTYPDPSQVFEINVPRQSTISLNANVHHLPTPNYFWQDIRSFISGIFNRTFGGGQ